MIQKSNLIKFLIATCRKSSDAIIRDFYELEKLQVSRKSLGGFVSNSDIKAENVIMNELSYFDPDADFLLEEAGHITKNDNISASRRWIVDAIDGTSNFIRGNPHFCISIALESVDNDGNRDIIAGIIHSPVYRDFYWATKGDGAYYIDNMGSQRRIKVSAKEKFNEVIGAFNGIPGSYSENEESFYQKLKEEKCRIRLTGSTALDLAYVASGKFDFYAHDKIKLWDVAAGSILVKEAMGKISDFYGKEIVEGGSFLASNTLIHQSLFL
jgi:myo-inositol-1(or 4)-monophosphatase